jgi:hypothetical protein
MLIVIEAGKSQNDEPASGKDLPATSLWVKEPERTRGG